MVHNLHENCMSLYVIQSRQHVHISTTLVVYERDISYQNTVNSLLYTTNYYSRKSRETHLANLKSCFYFSDRSKVSETMIKYSAFAILNSHDLMQNG